MMAGVGWKVGRGERGSKGGGAVTMGTTGGGDQDAQQGAAGWLAGWVGGRHLEHRTNTHTRQPPPPRLVWLSRLTDRGEKNKAGDAAQASQQPLALLLRGASSSPKCCWCVVCACYKDTPGSAHTRKHAHTRAATRAHTLRPAAGCGGGRAGGRAGSRQGEGRQQCGRRATRGTGNGTSQRHKQQRHQQQKPVHRPPPLAGLPLPMPGGGAAPPQLVAASCNLPPAAGSAAPGPHRQSINRVIHHLIDRVPSTQRRGGSSPQRSACAA